MCGITGFLLRAEISANEIGDRLAAMAGALAHRGPDADGSWIDPAAGVALGHRRLSIVDLSASGAQPMSSANGRWVTVYNGELYNTAELRAEVEKANPEVAWRGHSDTEVMLEAIALWGVNSAIAQCDGMFALALWDRQERRLWLVRDRLGIKPLYWARLPDGALLFGSELRALRSHPSFAAEIDPNAVAAYLRSACIPAPHTIYRHVHKLPPAHILHVGTRDEPTISCYWDLRAIAAAGQRQLAQQPEEELTDELERLLRDSVLRQMVSDVPLGAFLSGGIDSSTVVALMQAQSNRPVRTFSIGLRDERYDESGFARRVAAHLGTDHTELIVNPDEARAVIDRLPDIYDEPFADSSQIPTFLVSKLARQDVTVALSGDGGDECFGGYVRYHWIDRLADWTSRAPAIMWRGLGSSVQMLSTQAWETLLGPIPRRYRPVHVGDKLHKAAALLALGEADQMYRRVIAQWPEPIELMPDAREPSAPWDSPCLSSQIPDRVARMRYYDMMQYLPDDILTKVDRASMAVSLEVRVPLLGHRVVEYSWRLPRSALIRASKGKQILRHVLHRYVPPALVERQKTGFSIPIDEWIRGPLVDWASDLLSEHALSQTGLFDASVIRRRFEDHRQGRGNWSRALWTILMFQAWHRRWAS